MDLFSESNYTNQMAQTRESEKQSQPHIVLEIHDEVTETRSNSKSLALIQSSISPLLAKIHAGYFRITLSLSSQALLWKILIEPIEDAHALRRVFSLIPSTAFILIWSLALFTLITLSFLYILRCLFHFQKVKDEFFNPVGVNYLFAPWISWLLLLQSSPVLPPNTLCHQILWWVFVVPVVALDLKIYGQWFTKGKRFLSIVANPSSQLSVIGNLVGAQVAAEMGWRECALCLFSLGMAHYLVLFVTLYQRLSGDNNVPAMLRPVFFLFIAVPSVGSMAWDAICGEFDDASKLLFFLSLFLFLSLVSRPMLFKKAMKKFNVAWWAYSFPLTALALASTEYAQQVKGATAHALMLLLFSLSVLVSLFLMLVTVLHTHKPIPPSIKPKLPSSDSEKPVCNDVVKSGCCVD